MYRFSVISLSCVLKRIFICLYLFYVAVIIYAIPVAVLLYLVSVYLYRLHCYLLDKYYVQLVVYWHVYYLTNVSEN